MAKSQVVLRLSRVIFNPWHLLCLRPNGTALCQPGPTAQESTGRIPRVMPKAPIIAFPSQRDSPMPAWANGPGKQNREVQKPQRGGHNQQSTFNDATTIGPPRWGFGQLFGPKPRPMAWAGIGLPRCGEIAKELHKADPMRDARGPNHGVSVPTGQPYVSLGQRPRNLLFNQPDLGYF